MGDHPQCHYVVSALRDRRPELPEGWERELKKGEISAGTTDTVSLNVAVVKY